MNYHSRDLGQWDTETEGELLAIGCGVYATRNGDKTNTHLRGFRSSNDRSLFELVEEQSSKTHISIDLVRPLGLGEIVKHIHKRSENHLNEWIDEPKEIRLNFDTKRLWDRDFSNGNDLLKNNYDSKALLLTK